MKQTQPDQKNGPNEEGQEQNQKPGADGAKQPPQGKQEPKQQKPPGPGGPSGQGPAGPPEEVPRGNPPQLQDAYAFLQNYVANEMQGLPPGLPEEGGQAFQGIENVIPKTSTGNFKKGPNYGASIGSTPSPGLPTGQFPGALTAQNQQLVGGIPANQVKMQQMRLPSKQKEGKE
jgi:hypothetical protein